MKKPFEIHRQGDVLFIKIDDHMSSERKEHILKEAAGQKDLGKVIQEGEATGHSHAVAEGKSILVEREQLNRHTEWESGSPERVVEGTKILVAETPVVISHQEHHAKKLKKGIYVVRIQREYDEETMSRPVWD